MDNQALIEECKQSIDLVFNAFDIVVFGALFFGVLFGYLLRYIGEYRKDGHYVCPDCDGPLFDQEKTK